MGLDIRIPLGMLFVIVGGMLAIFGGWTRGSAIYASSLGVNVNLAWGAAMLVFGLMMLLGGLRSRGKS
jgi:hypothetical protein